MSKHITCQDGSIVADWPSDEGFGWQANRLHIGKGDTVLPPDERTVHGKAKSVGHVDDGERKDDNEKTESGNGGGKKRGALSRLFRKNEKPKDWAGTRAVM